MKKGLFNSKRFLLLLLGLFLTGLVMAQQRKITGTVTSEENGDPIPGVTIRPKGLNVGTITAADGTYSLTMPDGATILVFTYVGYEPAEVEVGESDVVNVELKLVTEEITGVVIIGYQSIVDKNIISSVEVIAPDDLVKSTAPTLQGALQGKAAGVLVTQGTGMPGAAPAIRIRGIGSINGDAGPLVVVDGIIDGDLSSISPGDVESMQVLKDASATAIYGARGANGVIIVTTKRGSEGKPKLSIDAYSGITWNPFRYDVLNAQQYCGLMSAAYATQSEREFPEAYTEEQRLINGGGKFIDTDWQDLVQRNMAKRYNANVSLSGGGENANFALSANYYSEQGILVGTNFDRFTIRANSDFKVKEWIKIGKTLGVSYDVTDDARPGNGNPWTVSSFTSPLMPAYEPENEGGYGGPTDTTTAINETTNPLAEVMLRDQIRKNLRMNGNVYAEIKPFKHLTYKIALSGKLNSGRTTDWTPMYELGNKGGRSNPTSTLAESSNLYWAYVVENLLIYTNTFGDHSINFLAGHTIEDRLNSTMSATKSGFANPNLNVLSHGETLVAIGGEKSPERMESYLGRLIYDFNEKYLIQASLRVDGSSKFGKEKYGYFPAFTLGWKINEDFLPNVQNIDMLKLRAGYGVTGNEKIGTFQYEEVVDLPDKSQYAFGINQDLYYGAASIWSHGNPLIQWERAEMYNIGFDLNAFKNKVEASVEYYYKYQNKMLVDYQLSSVYGKNDAANPPVNLGEMYNQGVDMDLSYKKHEGDFHYDIKFVLTSYKNKIIGLAGGNYIGDNTTREGDVIGAFYGYIAEGIFQDTTEVNAHAFQADGTAPGDIKFRDVNKDGKINDNDRVILGKYIPDFTYSIAFDADYKGFDLSLFLSGFQGFEVYNSHRAQIGTGTDSRSKDYNRSVDVLDYWTPENHSNTQTRLALDDPNNNVRRSTWWLESGNFIRLQSLQIGYTLPDKTLTALGMSRVRFYLAGNNLMLLTKYSGADPEVGAPGLNNGNDEGRYPTPRSAMFGVQLNF